MFKKIVSNFFIKKVISILGLAYILITYYTSKVTFSDRVNIETLCKKNENFIDFLPAELNELEDLVKEKGILQTVGPDSMRWDY